MRQHSPLDPVTGIENSALLPWIDGVPPTGTEGSDPGHALMTDQEAEILSVIQAAALTPSNDLTQLLQAIRILALQKVVGSGQVPIITANPVLYVGPAGSDANDGLTPATALATVGAAITKGRLLYYLVGTTLTIQLAANPGGSYALPSTIPAGAGTILIRGDQTAAANYTMAGAGIGSGSAVLGVIGATVFFLGVRFYNSGTTNHTLLATNNAVVRIDYCISSSLGGNANAHLIASEGGSLTIGAGNACDGNMGFYGYALGGRISQGGTNVTFLNTPTFSVATFAASSPGGVTIASGSSYSGAVNASRFLINLNAVINTFGAGSGLIAGSSAGTTSTGGQYA